MADEVPNLRGGHFETLKWILGLLGAVAMVVVPLIWQAAKYPDRAEFKEWTNGQFRMQLDLQHVKDVQDAMRADQERQNKDLSDKIDRVSRVLEGKKGNRDR